MGPKHFLNTWIFASALALAACSPVTEAPCPTPTAETRLYMNEEDGYCFLYPATAYATIPHFWAINPVPPGSVGDVIGDGWLSIEMRSANGLTAAEVADGEINILPPGGFDIVRTDIQIDGVPAVVVDGLPGPDSWRRVFVVANDRVYTLIFLPWGHVEGLEEMYTLAVRTLRFTPPTQIIPVTPLPWGPGHLPPPLVFEYPTDQQVLDYEGDYRFKVNDFPGEAGFLWSFSQNGVVIWENLRDEMGLTAGGHYAILAGSEAHARFAPGQVEVSVQAQFDDFLSDPVTITIILTPP